MEALASAVRRAAETRGINIGKEASVTRQEKEVGVHLGKKDMLVLCTCLENPREYIALLIEPIKGEGAGPPSPGPSLPAGGSCPPPPARSSPTGPFEDALRLHECSVAAGPAAAPLPVEDQWPSPPTRRAPIAPTEEQLRQEPWYHGQMSRRAAEKLLRVDGDFLVRDSVTNPGQYVLTGMHAGQPKHLLLVDPEGVVRWAWGRGRGGEGAGGCVGWGGGGGPGAGVEPGWAGKGPGLSPQPKAQGARLLSAL